MQSIRFDFPSGPRSYTLQRHERKGQSSDFEVEFSIPVSDLIFFSPVNVREFARSPLALLAKQGGQTLVGFPRLAGVTNRDQHVDVSINYSVLPQISLLPFDDLQIDSPQLDLHDEDYRRAAKESGIEDSSRFRTVFLEKIREGELAVAWDSALQKYISSLDLPVPDALLDVELRAELIKHGKLSAENEDVFVCDIDDFRPQFQAKVEKRIRRQLVLDAIAKMFSLTATQADLDDFIESHRFGRKVIEQDPRALENLKADILREKALSLFLSKVKINFVKAAAPVFDRD